MLKFKIKMTQELDIFYKKLYSWQLLIDLGLTFVKIKNAFMQPIFTLLEGHESHVNFTELVAA